MNQREIKFRAFGKETKRFLGTFTPLDTDFIMPQFCEDIDWVEFTGLTDKNGKEIYEGDINMDYENKKSEVVFYAGGFYLRYSETEYKAIGSFAPFNHNVIGNIYENSELLK